MTHPSHYVGMKVHHAQPFVATKYRDHRRTLSTGAGLTLSLATSCAFWALVLAPLWNN